MFSSVKGSRQLIKVCCLSSSIFSKPRPDVDEDSHTKTTHALNTGSFLGLQARVSKGDGALVDTRACARGAINLHICLGVESDFASLTQREGSFHFKKTDCFKKKKKVNYVLQLNVCLLAVHGFWSSGSCFFLQVHQHGTRNSRKELPVVFHVPLQ